MSFIAAGGGYALKLIYLPDWSHMQAIDVKPGLFGTASLAATVENGAMQTVNAANDNSKLLDAVAQIASSAVSGAKSTAAKTTPAASTKLKGVVAPIGPLHPGLYQFVYDETGTLTGIREMTPFPVRS